MSLAAPATAAQAKPAEQPEPDDAVLVQQLVAGDAAAGEQLVRRHSRSLLSYLRRIAGSVHAAEELHQQTWLSALEHIERFDPRGGAGFRAWIFRIATNKSTDSFRRIARERARHDRIARDPTQSPTPTPDPADLSHLDAEVGKARVRAAVARLPDAQRRVVELRFYGGLKFAEIAECEGCPLNTALGRMHKAVKKLRAALEDADVVGMGNAIDSAPRRS